MIYLYALILVVSTIVAIVEVAKGEDWTILPAVVVVCLSLPLFLDEHKVYECEKTLPRSEKCVLIAVPFQTLEESK